MSGADEVELLVATWRNLYMVVDNGKSAPEAYARLEADAAMVTGRYGANCGCLVVIPANATQPSEESRQAMNACFERQAHFLKGVAWVIEGRGFAAALVRATLTTMGLMRRKMRSWKVATDVDEALGWLATRVTSLGAEDVNDAKRVLEAVRQGRADGSRARP